MAAVEENSDDVSFLVSGTALPTMHASLDPLKDRK